MGAAVMSAAIFKNRKISMSYQIVVEQHGGRLLCCSELGKGTEFRLELPLGVKTPG